MAENRELTAENCQLTAEAFEIRLEGEDAEFDERQKFVISIIENRYGGELPFLVADYYPFKLICTDTNWITVRGRIRNDSIDPEYLSLMIGDVRVKLSKANEYEFYALALPHYPSRVPLFVTLNGITPISEICCFEYLPSAEDDTRILKDDVIKLETRLGLLLGFKAIRLALSRSRIEKTRPEIFLRTWLKKWLLERKSDGNERNGINLDRKGQGVIHICAMLGYNWAIMLYNRFGFSLDFKDRNGWTALHWAAYHGWEGTVLLLLNEGADVTLKTEKAMGKFAAGTLAKDIAINLDHQLMARELADAEKTIQSESGSK